MDQIIEKWGTQPTTIEQPLITGKKIQRIPYRSNGRSKTIHLDKPEMENWLHDPLEAMARELGPYTVLDMEKYIDDYSIELYNGWLVWRKMGHIKERWSIGNLQMMIDLPARKIGFGQGLPDGTECRLDEGNDIIPDASLVSWKRLEEDVIEHGPNKRPLLTKCPEFIVESRSTSNTRKADKAKREKYFAHGALIVWDVSEKDKFIDVYRVESPDDPQRFTVDDIIDCEPILPGWQRQVSDIFDKYVSAEVVAGAVAEEWREEGIEQGREEGIEQGREEGIEQGREEGIEQGREEGKQEERFAIARKLLQQEMTIDMIAVVTELDLAQIEILKSELDDGTEESSE